MGWFSSRIRTLACFAALLPLALHAEDEGHKGIPVEAKIDGVLVYSNQAVVRRIGRQKLEQERTRLLLRGLPSGIVDNSVRVRLTGDREARLINLEVSRVIKSTYEKEEAMKAKAELEELEQQMAVLEDDQAELDRRSNFLRTLEVGQHPKTTNPQNLPGPLEPEGWGALLDAVGGNLRKLAEERLELEDRMDAQERKLSVARARYGRLTSYDRKSSKTVALEIESELDQTIQIEVSYLIYGPQWFPRYSLRADLESGQVELVMDALVRQETGEDWTNARLEFSAAEPSRSADLPKLLAWHIGTRQMGGGGGGGGGGGDLFGGREKDGQLEYQKKEKAGMVRQSPRPRLLNRPSVLPAKQRSSIRAQRRRISPAATPPPMLGKSRTKVARKPFSGRLAQRTRNKLERVQSLYRSQQEALRRKQLSSFQTFNRQILEYQDDAEVQSALGEMLQEATGNLSLAVRLIESERLATGVVSPMQSSGGYDYKYRASRRETVPSDGAYSKVSLSASTCPAKFAYEAAPKLQKNAFLYATFNNPIRAPLLAGPAAIFIGNDFVTQGRIQTTSSGEPLHIGFGADESVAIKRTTESKRETAGWSRSRYDFLNSVCIKIRNNKDRDIQVRVIDQIPFSNDKKLIIKSRSFSVQPSEDKPTGLLRWDLTLAAGKESRIDYVYSIVHPSGFQIRYEKTSNTKPW